MTDPTPTPEPTELQVASEQRVQDHVTTPVPTSALPVDIETPISVSNTSPTNSDEVPADAARKTETSADTTHVSAVESNSTKTSSDSGTTTAHNSGSDTPADQSHAVVEKRFQGSAGRLKSLEHRTRKRENDLEKILSHLDSHTHITNDGIQKLLAVSDSTASRHARILISRGKLFRTGKGRSTRYTLAH